MTPEPTIAVIGLGYVGLPLAVEFGRLYPTTGFDIDADRIAQLRAGDDRTREVEPEALAAATRLGFTHDTRDIRNANVYIVTVPTPIDRHNQPDLAPLAAASAAVARLLAAGDVVIYESTVYPGATEEFCVPILERESGLAYNREFFIGYSPERINPGDRAHRLGDIVKVTSGSDDVTADIVDSLYASIIGAGTHRAQCIRVAEAAKVIENTQRDVNIALMNKLAMIFNRLGIETAQVLADYGDELDVFDPWVDSREARAQYAVELVETPTAGTYDGIIIAVTHREFGALGAAGIRALGRPGHVLYDLKQVLPVEASDLRL